jgi:hypothetical protein
MKFPRFHFRGSSTQGVALALNASRTSAGTGVLAVPVAVSVMVLIAAIFPVAPLRDAATFQGVAEVYLDEPSAYIAFAPFSDVFDAITLLSERQHIAVLLGLIGMWSLYRFAWRFGPRQGWRESTRSFAVLTASIVVVYTAAAYLPRPMAYLESLDPDVLRIDFHSHTLNSKDARRNYTAERNRWWHHAGGYDVAYVTDHGTFAGAEQGVANDPRTGNDGVILLGGIEANWKGEHVGLLGDEQMSRRLLSADLHEIDLPAPAMAGRRNVRAPIMIWNHPRDPRLEDLPVASGVVQAIEIANGAPRGVDLVRWKRQRIVELAKHQNLALLSGTDCHGWGYTAPNWTLLRVKGWRRLNKDELALRIQQALRVGGFGATHVVERATADTGPSTSGLALSVILVPWRMLTELSADERCMWLVWTWMIAAVELQRRRRRVLRHGIATSPAR